MKKANILIIYTGGTIGMKQDSKTLALVPYDFDQILAEVPELQKIIHTIDTYSFHPPIDSSDIEPTFWQEIASLIKERYHLYHGFVVLHGTDTMSYSASALSFMLENLEKPVIFTGSQLPIGMLRTDGKDNLISSIEIAAERVAGSERAMVPEVSIFFESELFRANRTTKYSAENFNAFKSGNYPPLAKAGIHIKYNTPYIAYPKEWERELKINNQIETNVAILKLYPGISKEVVKSTLEIEGLRALILESYGSGNAPTKRWFLELIEEATSKGLIILNITQCQAGAVDMEAYSTGILLKGMGVISGFDSTTEAALTKLFFLLGNYNNERVKELLVKNLRGEITTN